MTPTKFGRVAFVQKELRILFCYDSSHGKITKMILENPRNIRDFFLTFDRPCRVNKVNGKNIS